MPTALPNEIHNNRLIRFVLVLVFALSIAFFFVSPPTTPPDELAHLAYPREILLTHTLPSFLSSSSYWESHQPPLYYLLTIPFVKASETFSFETQVLTNRIPSILLLWGSLIIFYFIVKKRFAHSTRLQAVGLLAFSLPMVLYSSSSYSNDILVLFLATLGLFLLLFFKAQTNKHAFWLGIFFAVCLLAKIDLYPLALLLFAYFFYSLSWTRRFILTITTISASSWWFIHNLQAHTGLFGIKNTFILWNQKANWFVPDTWLVFLKKIFSGYIGIFGKYNIAFPSWVYIALFFLFVIPLIVGSIQLFRQSLKEKIILYAGLFTCFYVVIQNIQFFQPQGRYLIACVPFAAFTLLLSDKKIVGRFILPLFAVIVAFVGFSSIFLIHAYYQNNPLSSFERQRSLSILSSNWNGNKSNVTISNNELRVTGPASLFTLKDLRLLTSHRPVVRLNLSSSTPVRVLLYWKVLGQTEFSTSRMIEKRGVGDLSFQLNETLPTLIQDVKLEFPDVSEPFTLHSCTITTQ